MRFSRTRGNPCEVLNPHPFVDENGKIASDPTLGERTVELEKKRGIWYWINSARLIPPLAPLLLTLALFYRESLLWLMLPNPNRIL